MILVFEGGRRRFCMDCRFLQGGLEQADVEFMRKMLELHTLRKMLNNWLRRGQVMVSAQETGWILRSPGQLKSSGGECSAASRWP